MKSLRIMLVAASIFASTTAHAAAVESKENSIVGPESTCYLVAIVITADDATAYYACYDNGDGTA